MSRRNEQSTQLELDGVSYWLIHHAARRAPECLTSRLKEEWLADVESRSSALSRLRLSSGSESCGGNKGIYYNRGSKLRLLLPSLRNAIFDCGTSCRAFLRPDHDAFAYARIGDTSKFAESRAGSCAARDAMSDFLPGPSA
jgi:hypothetical protein